MNSSPLKNVSAGQTTGDSVLRVRLITVIYQHSIRLTFGKSIFILLFVHFFAPNGNVLFIHSMNVSLILSHQ